MNGPIPLLFPLSPASISHSSQFAPPMDHRHHHHDGRCRPPAGGSLPPLILLPSTFFVLLSLFPVLATSASPYFVNCGSSTNAPLDKRNFVADDNMLPLFTSSGFSPTVTDPNSPSSSTPYATARVFTDGYWYKFDLDAPGTHFLRLHFSPFAVPGGYNLSAAAVDVSANDSRLLTGFSAAALVIKEYLLWVPTTVLNVSFAPAESSPFGFVNAIEVFAAPANLVNATRPHLIGFAASSSNISWGRQHMEKIFRVNAGGPLISPSNDTLWRSWVNDEQFLVLRNAAVSANSTKPIQYQNATNTTSPSTDFAPEAVYSTLEQMNKGDTPNPNFNITWNFTVARGYKYLVRMHFCDFSSRNPSVLFFNVFVNDQEGVPDLQPFAFNGRNQLAPFFLDFVTDAEEQSGLIRVSVGRSLKSADADANAILNGLEILKLSDSSGNLDGVPNPGGPNSEKKGKSITGIIIGAVAGGVALVLVCALFLALCYRKRRPAPPPESTKTKRSSTSTRSATWTNIPGQTASVTVTGGSTTTPRPNYTLEIPLEEIVAATNGFDEALVVGSGGFGKVYKGQLNDGTLVAVKRGMSTSKQGWPEYQNEIMVLSQIRHRHLVALIGHCNEERQMILVYEYVPNGTLKDVLYGTKSQSVCLTWKQRLEICIGAARGLHYLHTGFTQSIIHRDVKSSNILLGEDYVAKVADFGLSRVGPSLGETHVSTAVKGSFGYMDPEYFKTQKLTDKSDVYSFGVVLFEVLLARPVIDTQLSREQLNLAEWATHWERKGQLEEVMDPRLRGTVRQASLRKFGETAVKCLEERGADRPAIGDVLWNLEYALQLQEAGEARRGVVAMEDSIAGDARIPDVVGVRRMALTNTRVQGDVEEGDHSESSDGMMTTSNVFSQLITGEGR